MTSPAERSDDIVEVVGAAIVRDGGVLCARRGPHGRNAGLWEFPGGKVEPGESPREALAREIEEELGCRVRVGEDVATTTHSYTFGTVRLTVYACALLEGEPRPTEHEEVRWVAPAELDPRGWAPADIPAVELIRAGALGG